MAEYMSYIYIYVGRYMIYVLCKTTIIRILIKILIVTADVLEFT